jgi:hypothetical protein
MAAALGCVFENRTRGDPLKLIPPVTVIAQAIKTRVAKLPDKARRLNDLAIRRALELAGVEFIDENGGGPGVRLRKPQRSKQSK